MATRVRVALGPLLRPLRRLGHLPGDTAPASGPQLHGELGTGRSRRSPRGLGRGQPHSRPELRPLASELWGRVSGLCCLEVTAGADGDR